MSAALQVLDGGRAPARGTLRERPHDVKIERDLLGMVLNDATPESAALCRQIGMKAGAFYEPALREIWKGVEACVVAGEVPDMATVMLRLKAAGTLEAVGGLAYLVRLTGECPATSLRLRGHAEAVKLLWERRHAMQLAEQFLDDCEGPATGERAEFTRLAGELGNRLVTLGRVEQARTLAERIDDVLAESRAAMAGQVDKSLWLPSGMEMFDRVLGAFGSGGEEDRFHGIAGGSSFGKSALVRQWSHGWVRGNKRVLIYTRETSINGWVRRSAAQAAGVNLRQLEGLPRDIQQRYEAELEWMRDVAANKLLFVFQNEMSTPLVFVEDVIAHYDAFEHLHGRPDAVVVDYLQILLPKKKCQSREQEVAYVSHLLQGRQRRAGNQWFVTAQMNEAGLAAQRLAKKDEQGRMQHRTPLPGDLRESQAFFHDADRMICLYRPPEDCMGRDQVGEVPRTPEQWLCQIKGREVGVGTVKCWFERPLTRFREFTRTQLIEAEQAQPSKVVNQPTSKADWKAKKQQQGGSPF